MGFLTDRPLTEEFLKATSGHSVIVNFSTTPQWMWVTEPPVSYPSDPDQPTWTYTKGAQLRDPSGKELGDYYARLVNWNVNGGFTDEFGKRHESRHHFKIPYWEVLNEPDFEHKMSPEQYTLCYDAIVSAVKFVGLALAGPSATPHMFEYFLNPANHRAGIPLDMISYHFYAIPTADQTPEIRPFTFFEQADHFLTTVRFVEEIRKRLSPSTRTTIDEIGSISADDPAQEKPGHVTAPISESYWNLSGRGIRVSVRTTRRIRHRRCGRIAIGWLSDAISKYFHGGLEYRSGQSTLSSSGVAQEELQPWRQDRSGFCRCG